MRYTAANIQALPPMPADDVFADVRKVALMSDLVGWQEIHLPQYVDTIQNLGAFEHRYLGGVSTPTSARRTRVRIVGQWSQQLHKPTPGITRAKSVTAVKVARVGNPRKQWVFTNRHMVNNTFAPQQKQMWEDGNKVDREFVAGFVKQGLPVSGVGDYNRLGKVMGTTIAGKKVHYQSSGIIHVWFIDGDEYKWDIDGVKNIPLNSDHDARMVRAQLRKT